MLSFKDFTDYCDLTEDGLRPLKHQQFDQELGLAISTNQAKTPAKTTQQTLQYLRKYLDYIESKQHN